MIEKYLKTDKLDVGLLPSRTQHALLLYVPVPVPDLLGTYILLVDVGENLDQSFSLLTSRFLKIPIKRKGPQLKKKKANAPAGNRTRVCTVAGYYSTTRPLVRFDVMLWSYNIYTIPFYWFIYHVIVKFSNESICAMIIIWYLSMCH